ncbi:hypothetical protein [Streptomyces sp. NBC_01578]
MDANDEHRVLHAHGPTARGTPGFLTFTVDINDAGQRWIEKVIGGLGAAR